ncbi:vWA domain-containing protein [Salibacter halophilus]|uniref:VWA domain-containing protein n=1 Tax=Salibacter halophilus TaxID=1803916 RepID=A0A6N6M9E7_9FLAO|nr:VWA domain-containing protein [Salibacter halophilus]KAB1065503.1 VWA domain-containing protein [Salibacter halophilus]
MFRFEHIEYLWALAILPVLILVFILWKRWRKNSIDNFLSPQLKEHILPNISNNKPTVQFIFFLIALILLIFGFAGPQVGTKLEEVKREGVELIVAVDVSNSMTAEDLSPNRLERAKRAIEKLVDRLQSDRIGMIVFAGNAYTQLPITTDYAAAKLFLDAVNTDIVPVQGTAIGDAIDLAMESFDMESSTSKAIIIISDGEDHEGGAEEAAEKAADNGVAVHTIGMGSNEGAPIPIYRGERRLGYMKNKNGETVVSKLNPDMLEDIADAGNGKFVQATNADAGLNYIFDEIGKMEKAEFGSKVYTDYENRFQYFLGAGLIFLVLSVLTGKRKSNIFGINKGES